MMMSVQNFFYKSHGFKKESENNKSKQNERSGQMGLEVSAKHSQSPQNDLCVL